MRVDGRNKLFLCLPWSCLGSGAYHPGSFSFIASCAILALAFFTLVVVSLATQLFKGLIMQGLGKTERAEQGRDIDLTSLRSTMPASGPLQVSAFRKSFGGQSTPSATPFLFMLSCPFASQSSSICDSASLFLSRLYHSHVVCPAYVRVEDQRVAVWLCGFGSVSEINLRWQQP